LGGVRNEVENVVIKFALVEYLKEKGVSQKNLATIMKHLNETDVG
jgi:hypothetical protein